MAAHKGPRNLPDLPRAPITPVIDLAKDLRVWWKRRPTEVVTAISLPKALAEVGILALAHLANRLADAKTPVRVRDQIALTMGPKLAIELRGRMPNTDEGGGSTGTNGLLEVYKVR